MRRALLVFGILAWTGAASAAPLVLDGDVPKTGGDFFYVPFEVPPGTVEIEVKHDDLSKDDILDFGLDDPNGFRGWGGGNEEPAVVGLEAASRSYLPGPVTAGTWKVVVGKAKLKTTTPKYHLEIELRTTATLPKIVRAPYAPAKALESTARWYAGDFHVHSRESGDARPPIDEIAAFARSRGLDFVELSDHNTVSQDDLIAEAQAKTKVLLLPGIEYTTYGGHANAIGATKWVNHRIGDGGATIDAAIRAVHAQGALFSLNHPGLDLGDQCIGCAWTHAVPPGLLDAIEIETLGYKPVGFLFHNIAINIWEQLLAKGEHVAAIGGSDDHQAGQEATSGTQTQIGAPTTMVFARELSQAALFEGIRAGRTVVKLQGPEDPMVDFTTDVTRAGEKGDTVADEFVVLRAHVTGGGESFRLVKNGAPLPEVAFTGADFRYEVLVDAPKSGEDRYRAEVLVDGKPRTISSHVFVKYTATGRARPSAEASDSACGCSSPGRRSSGLLGLGALVVLAARRRLRTR